MYSLYGASFIPGTEISCNQNIDTSCHANENSCKKSDKRSSRTYCPQGQRTCKLPDYRNICHIKQHLKQVCQHQRNAEKQHFSPDGACCQILSVIFHFIFLLHHPYFSAQKKGLMDLFFAIVIWIITPTLDFVIVFYKFFLEQNRQFRFEPNAKKLLTNIKSFKRCHPDLNWG